MQGGLQGHGDTALPLLCVPHSRPCTQLVAAVTQASWALGSGLSGSRSVPSQLDMSVPHHKTSLQPPATHSPWQPTTAASLSSVPHTPSSPLTAHRGPRAATPVAGLVSREEGFGVSPKDMLHDSLEKTTPWAWNTHSRERTLLNKQTNPQHLEFKISLRSPAMHPNTKAQPLDEVMSWSSSAPGRIRFQQGYLQHSTGLVCQGWPW